ncbi:hypothetical protein SPRG_16341 [Saprolegnia parasitica CBS 223.65]|uniref:Uncharacterized protein n=1 Tax=Saprolegnia parasitica (strain CBS 223.65) TaxID=695850 RepID=A0A067BUG9_SAPPC|nr:hypothetical protein SPRG_16341 [Saprolegnia parasitica CBS 223.65]KDO18237.1 hypothetical protein SPRG_16341 [Saprolegnia parasitica CBS 223.65]|eukprot:XP_012211058.1 hypothetical protein SPRG_16341 [Saprolegnia parasitica CBS 223.65]
MFAPVAFLLSAVAAVAQTNVTNATVLLPANSSFLPPNVTLVAVNGTFGAINATFTNVTLAGNVSEPTIVFPFNVTLVSWNGTFANGTAANGTFANSTFAGVNATGRPVLLPNVSAPSNASLDDGTIRFPSKM